MSHRLLAVNIGRLLTRIEYYTVDVRSYVETQYFCARKTTAPGIEDLSIPRSRF